MEEHFDVGIVTSNGIWFDGKVYSCSLAVRQQWFKQAERIGGWPVYVRSNKDLKDQIEVELQDGSCVTCIRIDHIPVNTSKRESYYLEFQRLAALRKQHKEELNQQEYRSEDHCNSDKPTNN